MRNWTLQQSKTFSRKLQSCSVIANQSSKLDFRFSEIFGEFSEMHFLGNIVWTGSTASQKIDLYWTKFCEVFKNSLYYLLVPTASRFAKVR